jgi:hypothetical protein
MSVMINGCGFRWLLGVLLLGCDIGTAQELDNKPVAKMTRLKQPIPVKGWCDIAPQQYPHLMPHYREVPDELNAVPLLLEAKSKLVGWDEMHRVLRSFEKGDIAWDMEFWGAQLKKNEAALARVDQALKRPWLQIPVLLSPSDETAGLMVVMQVASLKSIQCIQHLEKGNEASSLDALKDLYHLSEMCMHTDGGLIGWLVGVACYDVSFRLTGRLLQKTALTSEKIEELEALLKKRPSVTERAQEAFRMEALMYMSFFGELYRGNNEELLLALGVMNPEDGGFNVKALSFKIVTCLLFQPNKTIKMHAEMTRYGIVSAETPRWRRAGLPKPSAHKLLNRDLSVWNNISSNAVGRMLFTMATPMVLKQVEKVETLHLGHRVTQTLCALRHFHSQHNMLPDDLKALVPDYLAAIPLDPYDGKALRYSKIQKRLWSVGEDGKDEGGLDAVKPFTHFRKMRNEPTYLIRFEGVRQLDGHKP